jgi:1,2-diacylglycerol 3-alpha-glucosyltransferase
VARILQEERIDIVHTHTEFGLGWAGKRAAQRMKLPLVHSAHTLYDEYRHYLPFGRLLAVSGARLIHTYLRLFVSGYDALVCPSSKAQGYFRSFAPHARTVPIGNGIDRARFRPGLLTEEGRAQARQALGLQPADRVILYAGRLAKEKRVVELLSTLIPLLREHPHTKVLLVGAGPAHRRLRQAAEKGRVRDQVVLAGYVGWEQISRLYSLADLFVTASLSEMHPLTLIEAAMCGLPIVARRDDAYTDLVRDGDNGYLVDSDRQIADRAAKLLDDETELHRLGRNGLALSDRLSAQSHVDKVEALYCQVIRERSALAV